VGAGVSLYRLSRGEVDMWLSRSRWREVLAVGLPLLVLLVGAFWLAFQFVQPAPPRRVVMTTGSEQGAYHAFGKKYQAALAKAGITLELKPSAGSMENIARLNDPKSGVSVGFVQGGLTSSETSPDLSSLGRTFLEPLWIFHRADLKIDLLSGFAGKRIGVGPEGSGTRVLAMGLLKSSGITADNSTFLPQPSKDVVDLLLSGKADAIFLSMAPQSELVQKLLHDTSIKLFNFTQAEALSRLYPYLTRIVLPTGVIDLAANIPAQDVSLVAPGATLVVRSDLHPAIVGLLVNAAKDIHSGPGLFQKPGEYPMALDTELPMDADAARYYKNGLPFLQRYLPFHIAVFLERMMVMIIPVATILLPLIKIVPMAYNWRIKRRIMFWYGKLKSLERQVKTDRSPSHLATYRDEIKRIEEAVSVIPIPLNYYDQVYALRSAVALVHQRIMALSSPQLALTGAEV
jgi:TRAP transporter TAXI family solute receptor